jgi:hypothetical protein
LVDDIAEYLIGAVALPTVGRSAPSSIAGSMILIFGFDALRLLRKFSTRRPPTVRNYSVIVRSDRTTKNFSFAKL